VKYCRHYQAYLDAVAEGIGLDAEAIEPSFIFRSKKS
jgi:hypothetical protein